jgi:hypothetical protein
MAYWGMHNKILSKVTYRKRKRVLSLFSAEPAAGAGRKKQATSVMPAHVSVQERNFGTYGI